MSLIVVYCTVTYNLVIKFWLHYLVVKITEQMYTYLNRD